MPENFIKIRGARVHNLQNIDVDIPKNKLVVITGLSGSGKSSLAFDTLYAEGQRRYLESLSAYARQFLGVLQKPDVDKIEGISPAIAIDQRKASHNPRSTVGTITEIYDYLRLLFARAGEPHCPKCGKKVGRQTIDQIALQVYRLPKRTEIMILGPVIRSKKGEHSGVLEEIKRAGFVRVRIDGIVYRIEEALGKALDGKRKHDIEVVVDRLVIDKSLDKSRLVDSLETALKLGKGVAIVSVKRKPQSAKSENEDLIFSEHFACEECGVSLPEIEPRLFSFNSPYGACPACQGLGERLEVDPKLVIPNPNLTLGEGAIFPWAHASHKTGRQGFFWRRLQNLSEKHKVPLDIPVKELSKEAVKSILYGDKNMEGVIPWLERRYHQTDSDYARAEIGQYMAERLCEECQEKRLKPEALAVTVSGLSIDKAVDMSIADCRKLFENLLLKKSLTLRQKKVSQPILKEILNRLQFLIDVGLDYLSLSRKASTLAGGEEQRIRLATQLGSQLTGVLYILDEPSVGLHVRDQQRLIRALKKLRDLGNTIIIVEHSKQAIEAADWIIDIGPGAGKHGGKVVFSGTPKQLLKSKTLTGDYLAGRKTVEISKCLTSGVKQVKQEQKNLVIKGAKEHNLKSIDVKIPLGRFVCITGVSGSGKSSLMNDILAKALMKKFYRAKEEPGKHQIILGLEHLDKVVLVDQSPIGRTPRSNPATYSGAFSHIRDLFSKTREARIKGYRPGRFSFNVKGGRCEACEGQGEIKIEMYFLPDVYQECQECKGKRFNQETLAVEYIPAGEARGKNIAQVLEMTIEEALGFFKNIPALVQKLKTLNNVGLGYIELGQPAVSLSGGEAQRVKLAAELSKKATGKSLYILDEPTTGLHPDDIKKLLYVLKELVNRGNTVICIEHELDVVKNADYVIDLGPEGGDEGGYIVAEGTPLEIIKSKRSYTGEYLKNVLGK
ncbi:MAG: excinuclease ABC subunit UvrA [bacterium]|nr:excinuclease ABC subunit UvrA [bacterium]